mgnify:FL=1
MKTYNDLPEAVRGDVDLVVTELRKGGRERADAKYKEIVLAKGLPRVEASALAMYSLLRGQELGYLVSARNMNNSSEVAA